MARKKKLRVYYDTEFIEDGKTIDLISIGMVDENGREFYAISSEFDESKASDWVKTNVLVHLPSVVDFPRHTKGEIRTALLEFVGNRVPEWWAYYCSYDHVVLCQLFGSMVDLPDTWPKFTLDIKQYAEFIGVKRLPKKGSVVHDAVEDAKWNKKAHEFLVEKTRVEQL
jgi:hypothetical protein